MTLVEHDTVELTVRPKSIKKRAKARRDRRLGRDENNLCPVGRLSGIPLPREDPVRRAPRLESVTKRHQRENHHRRSVLVVRSRKLKEEAFPPSRRYHHQDWVLSGQDSPDSFFLYGPESRLRPFETVKLSKRVHRTKSFSALPRVVLDLLAERKAVLVSGRRELPVLDGPKS